MDFLNDILTKIFKSFDQFWPDLYLEVLRPEFT